jgi:hypothetical protein
MMAYENKKLILYSEAVDDLKQHRLALPPRGRSRGSAVGADCEKDDTDQQEH